MRAKAADRRTAGADVQLLVIALCLRYFDLVHQFAVYGEVRFGVLQADRAERKGVRIERDWLIALIALSDQILDGVAGERTTGLANDLLEHLLPNRLLLAGAALLIGEFN